MNDFSEQVAIVTGAASGLGLAIARKLHDEGAIIALLDLNKEAVGKAAEEIGSSAVPFTLDLTQPDQVENVVGQIIERHSRIDILVNSAGVTGKTNIKSHEVDPADLRFVFDVNFMASYFTARAVLPHMLKRNYGRSLHTASIAGKEGNAGRLACSASKAAVIGMPKVQGKEYA